MKTKERFRIRDFAFEVKSTDVNADGTFTGYASVFDNVDSYREKVQKGAFVDSIATLREKKRTLPMLWQHRSDQPIGFYPEFGEDDIGLRVRGQLLINANVPLADQAYSLMKAGVISGLSIGYYVNDDSRDEKTGVVTLKKLELVEASPVTFPANDDARIDAVKAKLAHGGLPTVREFEQILREVGFSKSKAAIVASRGLPHLLSRGEPDAEDINAIADTLRTFSLLK